MKNLFKQKNREGLKRNFKLKNIVLIFLLVSVVFIAIPNQPVHAQVVVATPLSDALKAQSTIWGKMQVLAKYAWKNAGAIAYHQALSLALDKIAYDAATYVGSAAAGQHPTFITKPIGQYLADVGDAAAGQFVESFVNNMNKPIASDKDCNAVLKKCNTACITAPSSPILSFSENLNIQKACFKSCTSKNTACAASGTKSAVTAMNATPSFNICGASSLQARVKIGLGLVNEKQPQAPDCSASKMVRSWKTDIAQKIKDLHNPDYVSILTNLFNPASNDLGIYLSAQTDLSSKDLLAKENAKTSAIKNQGWLNVTGINGKHAAPPGTSKRRLQEAQAVKDQNFGKITTNVLVDAANIALNQFAMTLFNNLLKKIGAPHGSNTNYTNSATNYSRDPNSGLGATALGNNIATLLKPNFGSQTDYSILSSLAVCLDPKNPAPDNCVIDNQFMSAISEKKTVAEALASGYLHSNWRITNNTSGDAYKSSYSLRDISILVKYRILPIGWREATQLATSPDDPHNATLGDLLACFSPNDNYDKFSSGFDTHHTSWCQGLVDPNWVLTAPLNYCRKKGYGAQIIGKTVIAKTEAIGSSPAIPSKLNVTRADDYCADNQTCIKENNDGSCEAYGYCNGEKRVWKFNTDSCNPINNTCQSFLNPNGQTVSYLQNTLNYGTCNSGNAGCRQYALSGTYSSSTGIISWNKSNSLYLDNNLGTCQAQDNACTGLIQVKPFAGNNLVMNSDFNQDQVGDSSVGTKLNNWPLANVSKATIVDASQDPGGFSGKALKLKINAGSRGGAVYSNFSNSLLPNNFQVIPDEAYTLSADVYIVGGGTQAGTSLTLILGSSASAYTKTISTTNSWQHLTLTRPANSSYNEPDFMILAQNSNNTGVVYIKNIKFEVGSQDTNYSSYSSTPNGSARIYEKLLPKYLEDTCYVNPNGASKNYDLKSDAPAICSNYAPKCNQSEIGCEAYTNNADKFTVSAQVTAGDYCPTECLGYDVYISQKTYFNSPAKEDLIPKTSTTCSAAAVGCNQFTNLDALNQGGEQKEYYTRLKQCIKPDSAKCSNFYAWQGQKQGYQLQAYSLKNNNGQPAVTSADQTVCNATIYNLPLSDPNYNPDCQEFYSASGQASYHLISRTITCSANCHTYRMTNKNVDSSLDETSCTGVNKHWNSETNNCDVCLNGGIWSSNSQACLYNAIPGQGQTCRASENNCREYNGNSGSQVRLIDTDDFENGLNSWSSSCGDTSSLSLSSVSNNKDGHSLLSKSTTCTRASAQLDVSGQVTEGKAYTLKFLALASADTNLQIYFINKDTGVASKFFQPLTIKGDNTWHIYQTNLNQLDKAVGNNEELVITGSANFYLDDFVLSEITDRYYLIAHSSQIPNSCYYDSQGNYQGPDYNLSCASYTNRAGDISNLRKFNNLCSDSAVGCEQMINTQNYSSSQPGYWESGIATTSCLSTDPNCVIVPGDSAINAVYDPSKQCSASSQGCSLVGQGQGGQNLIAWSDVFKLNNPDQYSKTLCSQDDLGCTAWPTQGNTGTSYFKDPGSNVCVYRASQDPTKTVKNWYKIPVKRCDLNHDHVIDDSEIGSSICLNDSDCDGSQCIIDNNDYQCDTSDLKTIALSNQKSQAPSSAVGLCNAAASGCTEYIDPVSKFNPNLVNNPGFVTSNNGDQDSWGNLSLGTWPSALSRTQQVISLEPGQLYSFSVASGNGSGVSLSFKSTSPVRQLLSNNTFGQKVTRLELGSTPNTPLIFDSLNNKSALLSGGASDRLIKIKKLVVNYQLQSNIDKTTCSGQVQFNKGCVLFNERTVGSLGPASLPFNAYSSSSALVSSDKSVSPTSCDGSNCNANQVIKVSPNRVCSQWLACTSYVQDPTTHQKTCYSYGECNSLNSQNECASFIDTSASILSNAVDSDASGYSILNDYNLSQMKIVGASIPASYDFESIQNGLSGCKKDDSVPCLINNPDAASLAIATTYPAQGASYLAIPASQEWTSKPRSVETTKPEDYYLSYMVNTSKSTGVGAKVTITPYLADNSTGTPIVFTTNPNLPWTREVNKFNLSGVTHITIALSSDSVASSTGPVYFDDINISPVLQVAPNKYVAPECRLYPTGSSLSCLDKNKNTIKPGLEGYCLEHDPANRNVCLLWYPLDNIPVPNLSVKGYSGKFPLNYCAEANGNFSLLEKRKAYVSLDTKINNEGITICGKYYHDGGLKGTSHTSCTSESCSRCPTDYNTLLSWQWKYYKNETSKPSALKIICIPKKNNLFPYFQTSFLFKDTNINNLWGACVNTENGDGSINYNTGYTNGYGIYDGLQGPEATNMDPPLRVYDYNNPPETEANLKLPYATSTSDSDKVFNLACDAFVQTVDSHDGNRAWTGRITATSETTPLFFNPYSYVLHDYGQSRMEAPYGGMTGSLDSQLINFNNASTRKGTKVAGRPYGCTNGTSGDGCNLLGYCSKAQDTYCLITKNSGITTSSEIVINDIATTSVIATGTIVATNSQTIIIGGVNADTNGTATSNSYSLADHTCGKDGGTCIPLWTKDKMLNTGEALTSPYESILKNIFLTGTIYKYSNGRYSSGSNDKYNFSNFPYSSSTIPVCGSNGGSNVREENSFCAVRPTLSNIKLYYNNAVDNKVLYHDFASNDPLSISRGWYRLEFNSLVDPEQQPLSKIEIEWGDGYVQTVTNQDNHPATSTPHVFYHNYRQNYTQGSEINIKIKIIDNWGFYAQN